MRKKEHAIIRVAGLLLLLLFVIRAQGQFNEKTGFTKYVVDRTNNTTGGNTGNNQGGPCSITGDSSVIAGSVYTYTLNCAADYWSVIGGVATNVSGTQISIQWSTGSSGGSLRAYRDSTGLFAAKKVIIAGANALTGGTISNPTQTISSSAVAQQINALAATGGNCGGNYLYQWQRSTEINGTYVDIAGATGQSYQPGNLAVTTYFKRKVICDSGVAYTSNTATVTVTANAGGGIAANANSINTIPAKVDASLVGYGANNNYQSLSSVDNFNLLDIRRTTGPHYLLPDVYVTGSSISDAQTIGMANMIPPLNGGCITSADQIILFGNLPSTINATAASAGSCSSNYAYQWQSSTDNIYFYDIPGATSQNLSFSSALAQTTWFQRRTICGSEAKYTNSSNVTMTSTIYYNVQISGTFTRNNCASGYTGSSVTYTVAAGTYASAVSQADADQKAQDDVNANGQTYANNNGVCNGPVTITLTNAFVGTTYPASIKIEFLQGGNVMQTNYFASDKTASTNITLPSGTYTLRFTMPSGFSSYYVAYDKNNPYQYWDNAGSGLTLTTGSVSFVTGTAYTITASNSIP